MPSKRRSVETATLISSPASNSASACSFQEFRHLFQLSLMAHRSCFRKRGFPLKELIPLLDPLSRPELDIDPCINQPPQIKGVVYQHTLNTLDTLFNENVRKKVELKIQNACERARVTPNQAFDFSEQRFSGQFMGLAERYRLKPPSTHSPVFSIPCSHHGGR